MTWCSSTGRRESRDKMKRKTTTRFVTYRIFMCVRNSTYSFGCRQIFYAVRSCHCNFLYVRTDLLSVSLGDIRRFGSGHTSIERKRIIVVIILILCFALERLLSIVARMEWKCHDDDNDGHKADCLMPFSRSLAPCLFVEVESSTIVDLKFKVFVETS
jgi:hypothetical protein